MTTPRELLERAWFAATDWVWPRSCFLCEASISDPAAWCLCPACLTALTTDPHRHCPRCTSSVGPHVETSDGCPKCHRQTFRFDSATRLGAYDGVLRDAVLRVKQPEGGTLAEVLGAVFAAHRREQLLAHKPERIVPVPLHWTRWWTRRHNQAEAVARGMAAVLNVPLARRVIRRVRATPMQSTLTAAERRRNLDGAFRPSPLARLQGVRVLLVDDVLTTGATADAAAAAIRAAGAAQVHAAVLAHR